MAGVRTEDTMQVYVQLGDVQCLALLDSGSTHNFVRGDIARRVGLRYEPCPGMGVIVANGDRVECRDLRHLNAVLTTLRQHHLHVKCSKCAFATTSVAYLGHVINGDGVAMDGEKVEAVATWPPPRSARGLRGFLGLAGYYRWFIQSFGAIAAPLTALLKKDGFMWTLEAPPRRGFEASPLRRAGPPAT